MAGKVSSAAANEKLSIKITSLAKYIAGAEQNDEVENGLKALTVCAHVRGKGQGGGWKRVETHHS